MNMRAKNLNISLTEALSTFVKSKVSSGRFTSSSEVVSEALHLMEQRDQLEAEKLRWLQKSWETGINSGDAGEVDFADLKMQARKHISKAV